MVFEGNSTVLPCVFVPETAGSGASTTTAPQCTPGNSRWFTARVGSLEQEKEQYVDSDSVHLPNKQLPIIMGVLPVNYKLLLML